MDTHIEMQSSQLTLFNKHVLVKSLQQLDIITMTRHLHTYPKTFNRWGHLKRFPFQAIPHYNFSYIFLGATAMLIMFYSFNRMTFQYLNSTESLQADKNQLLIKKRSFDTLILGNKIKSQTEQVLERSFF